MGGPAPSGLPRTLPSSAAPPPAVDAARFESLLLATPREASLNAALRRIAGLWGDPPLERTSLRTHLDQVRRLDLPVILEVFHPSRRDTCFLALLALETDTR